VTNSQTGLLGTHHDCAAFGATDNNIGRRARNARDLAAVDFDSAGTTTAGLKQGRAGAAECALLLVDRQEIGGELDNQTLTVRDATLLRLVQIGDGVGATTLGVNQLFFCLRQLRAGVIVICLQRLTLFHDLEQLVFEKPLPTDEAAEFVFEFGELLGSYVAALQESAVFVFTLTNSVDLTFELADIAIDVVDLDFDADGRILAADALSLETVNFLLLGKRTASMCDPGELRIHAGEVEKLGLHLWLDVHAV
jgi:hypothetical protein